MPFLIYGRLIILTAGALLYLFLLALIVGHRRPRRFERVLFFLTLMLFLYYAGALLAVNAAIHHAAPPAATEMFANGLILAALALLPGLLVHAEVEYVAAAQQNRRITIRRWLLVAAFYLPVIYFAVRILPQLIASQSLEFLRKRSPGAQFFGIWLGLALAVSATMELRSWRREPDARTHQQVTGRGAKRRSCEIHFQRRAAHSRGVRSCRSANLHSGFS